MKMKQALSTLALVALLSLTGSVIAGKAEYAKVACTLPSIRPSGHGYYAPCVPTNTNKAIYDFDGDYDIKIGAGCGEEPITGDPCPDRAQLMWE